MYCNRCGNQLPAESQFCNRCGNRVQAENSPRRGRGVPPAPRVHPARRRLAVGNDFEEVPAYEYEEDEAYSDVEDDEEVEEHETAKEGEIIFTIFPAFYGVATQYVTVILLSIATTALFAYFKFPLWIALAFAAICFIKPISSHIHNRHIIYRLTTTKIEIRSGLLSVKSLKIPLRSIQGVMVSQTLKERLIGIGDVEIDSAAVEGKIVMTDIKDPGKYAEMILEYRDFRLPA